MKPLDALRGRTHFVCAAGHPVTDSSDTADSWHHVTPLPDFIERCSYSVPSLQKCGEFYSEDDLSRLLAYEVYEDDDP